MHPWRKQTPESARAWLESFRSLAARKDAHESLIPANRRIKSFESIGLYPMSVEMRASVQVIRRRQLPEAGIDHS
jgi:hypothetical protein